MFKKIKWMVTISIFLIISTIFLFSQVALAKGKWQIGPHYGIWDGFLVRGGVCLRV